jgi:hypothetical protein
MLNGTMKLLFLFSIKMGLPFGFSMLNQQPSPLQYFPIWPQTIISMLSVLTMFGLIWLVSIQDSVEKISPK